jgi:hypothetical protein
MKRPMSNDELLHHLMLYSKHGSLMQLIVMEALRNYADAIVEAQPGFLGSAALMFNEDDWRNCCQELLDTLANRGQLMTEEISVEVDVEDFEAFEEQGDPAEAERAGLFKVLEHLSGQGWQPIELWDTEEWLVFGDGVPLQAKVKEAAQTDMATLRLRHDDGRIGSIGLVWGNSPLELIADYTLDHGFEGAVQAAQRSVWPNYPEE